MTIKDPKISIVPSEIKKLRHYWLSISNELLDGEIVDIEIELVRRYTPDKHWGLPHYECST